MCDGPSHLCHTGLQEVARPAGLEPATLGLEVRRKEATGGSGRPLLPCLLASSTAAGNPTRRGLDTVCLPFVSRAPHLRAEALQVPSPRPEPQLGTYVAGLLPRLPDVSFVFARLGARVLADLGNDVSMTTTRTSTFPSEVRRSSSAMCSQTFEPRLGNRRPDRSVAWCQPGGVEPD